MKGNITSPLSASVTRRQLLKGASGLALGLATMSPERGLAQTGLEGRKIVFASWGGQWQQAMADSFCNTFATRTGSAVLQAAMDDAKLRTMVEGGGASEWDVVDIATDLVLSGRKAGLYERLDKSVVGVDRVDPRFVDDYACGSGVWSWNVGYNTTLFPTGKEPRSWSALFDFDQYPGVRAIGDRVNPMLEVALLADGVAPADLYPLDVDRAFTKLDALKGKSIFWSTHAQCLQLLASGEAALGLASSTRMFAGKRDGAPVAASWGQNLQTGAFLAVVKGSTNPDLGWILIDEMTKPENQAIVARRIGLSPTNLKAFDLLEADVAAALPTAPGNIKQSVLIDETYWQDHAVELEERWTAWKLA